MKTLLLILTLFSARILACDGAYQQRLFPLGKAGDKLIVIRTSLSRYTSHDTRWRGTIKLFSLDKKDTFRLIRSIDSLDFADADYISELKRSFLKAEEITHSMPGFVKANRQSLQFCSASPACEGLSLRSDSLKNSLSIVTANKTDLPVVFPEELVAASQSTGGIVCGDFIMGSVRSVSIGDKSVIIVHVVAGEEHNTPAVLAAKDEKEFVSAGDCLYKERILYHGIGFDRIIWEK